MEAIGGMLAVAVVVVLVAGAWAWLLVLFKKGVRGLFGYERIIVQEFEAVLLYVNGAFVRVLGPGGHWLRHRAMALVRIDMRPETFSAEQWVDTKDNMSVFVRWGARLIVANPRFLVEKTQNYGPDALCRLQTCVRRAFSRIKVGEIRGMASKTEETVKELADQSCREIGLSCLSFEILDARAGVDTQEFLRSGNWFRAPLMPLTPPGRRAG